MGFSDKVIRLIQGLMSDATATVHHDGDFTEDFPVTRGVRQGCPLAPFLFALSTEPLMRMLQQAAQENIIQGLRINESHQLLFSLFADDTGLCLAATRENFLAAKEIVETFERISGAQLNVGKSLIVPMGLDPIPRWLFETGCRVASEGEIWTYLGTPIGLRDKEDGGLGFRMFKDQAQTLKMRLTSRLLEGSDCEWAHLAGTLLQANFKKKKKHRGMMRSAEEVLLLEDAGRVQTSKTLKYMLSGWGAGKKNLSMVRDKGKLPLETKLEVVIRAGEVQLGTKQKGWTAIKRRLKTMRVTELHELQGRTWDRLKAADQLGFLPDTQVDVEGPCSEAMSVLETWVGRSSDQVVQLADPSRWRWKTDNQETRTSWHRSLQEWRKKLIPEYKLREKMNASWGLNWDTTKWKEIWKGLWRMSLPPRDEIWLWRILNKGFFTLERAATMEIGDPICQRCERGTENIEHLFMQCEKTAANWNYIESLYSRCTGKVLRNTSLPGRLEYAVKQENLAVTTLLVTNSRLTWRSRCKKVYEGRKTTIPTKVILQEADRTTTSIAREYMSQARLASIKTSRRELAQMRVMLSNDKTRRDQRIFAVLPPPVFTQWHDTPETPEEHEDRSIDRDDALAGHQPKERHTHEERTTRAQAELRSSEQGEWARPISM
ncbi:hypothetical protein R1sor_009087 [Riccia sorocarpa]|uniref:Reverse transcriptase domain-containing protein n=1 Tax=Riccia sorocarpa TaxID=122646 RepID=A0ABD3H5D0_9MARC